MAGDDARITELGGGVSNTVLLVETRGCRRFVLKQALGKLRVEDDWFSDRERIFRESARHALARAASARRAACRKFCSRIARTVCSP